jgi:hypothetical protein
VASINKGCHNNSCELGLVEEFVTFIDGSHHHHAVLQHGQVREVSIEDLHTHGVLADGHLDGLFQVTHHIRHLFLCHIAREHCELVELYAVVKRHSVPQVQTFSLCPIDAHPQVFFVHVFDNAVQLSLGFGMNKLAE